MSCVLSVIIPCFNNGIYLKEMMDCCIRQTLNDWELIIVDDQSTDSLTQNIVYEYTAIDSRIKFFIRDREPKGSVVCRNIGFSHAKGKYIIHFDADDLISPTCFEKRVNYMEAHQDCDYASFIAKSFTENTIFPPTLNSPGVTFGLPKSGDLLSDFLGADYSFSVWNNIYKRESIIDILWDEKVCIYTDFSYILQGLIKGLKHNFSDNNDIDYYYRVAYSKNNMCASYSSDAKHISTIHLFQWLLNELDRRPDAEARRTTFLRFVVLHFERLILGNKLQNVNEYISLLKRFYPDDIVHSMSRIAMSCCGSSKDSWRKIKLDFQLYRYFRYSVYRTQFIHDLGKFVLGRKVI